MREKQLVEKEAVVAEKAARRTAMQEKQRTEEAARRAMQQEQKQHTEEAVATPSHESEVDGPTGHISETSFTATKDKTHSPTQNSSLTRQEIISFGRERAWN